MKLLASYGLRFIGTLLVYFALFAIFTATIGSGGFNLALIGLGIIIGFPLLILGNCFISQGQKYDQEFTDAHATVVVQDPAAHFGRFFLYLRPFDSTNAFKVEEIDTSLFGLEQYYRDGFDDVERFLAKSLETYPLVSLGKPGEHRGSGRVAVEETEWKVMVKALIANSRAVFVLPGENEGTTWEMMQLSELKALDKCIMLAPPTESIDYPLPDGYEGQWARTISKWRQFGIVLPSLSPNSGFLTHAGGGVFAVARPFPPPLACAWVKALQQVCDALPAPRLALNVAEFQLTSRTAQNEGAIQHSSPLTRSD